MKKFLKYIKSKTEEELRTELCELFSSFEIVKDHYNIKISQGQLDSKVLKKYQNKIREALQPDYEWHGGFDVDEVEEIVSKFNNNTSIQYYFELGMYAIEECNDLAEIYQGDFGDEFFVYFVELYENIIDQVLNLKIENKYKVRLKTLMENSFDGYDFQDDLRDIYQSKFNP